MNVGGFNQIFHKAERPKTSEPQGSKVTDVPFDRGVEVLTDKHGNYVRDANGQLQEVPAKDGLIYADDQTFKACESKIGIIQKRQQELLAQGVKPDEKGDFRYSNSETGEAVTVLASGDVKVYEQVLPIKDDDSSTLHSERFEVKGNKVHVETSDDTKKIYTGIPVTLFGEEFHVPVPFVKSESSKSTNLTMGFRYEKTEKGFKSITNDEWNIS